MESCTALGGAVDHNLSLHTKITLSGTAAPAEGFEISISGVFGRKLDEDGDGDSEADVNGTSVNKDSGIFINSGLNGSYKIVKRLSGTSIVVKKKRDINIRDTSDNLYSRTGATGRDGQLAMVVVVIMELQQKQLRPFLVVVVLQWQLQQQL